MKTKLIILFILFTISLPFYNYAQQTGVGSAENKINAEDLQRLLGDWTGSLTYMDYSSNKPYTMPANLSITARNPKNHLSLFYIYPNEADANGKGKIKVSRSGMKINKKEVISKKVLMDGQVEITTEYKGKDNRKKALIRNVYVIGDNQFVMRKEIMFDDTEYWQVRNEYSFVK